MLVVLLGLATRAESLTPNETLSVDRVIGQQYVASYIDADFSAALTYLGITSVSDATVVGINMTDGSTVDNSKASGTGEGNYDGWRNASGDFEGWGDNAAVCVKFSTTEAKFTICDMGNSNVPAAGEKFTCQWGLQANSKTYVYQIEVNFLQIPEYSFDIVKTITVNVDVTEKTPYSSQSTAFPISDVTDALGVTDIATCDQYIVKVSDGKFVSNSTDGWRDATGDPAGWGTAAGGVCVKLSDASSGVIDYIGCIDDSHLAGDTYTAKWGFVYNEKAVVIDVVLNFVPAETSYVTFTENGANADKSYYYATYETAYATDLDECDFEAYTVSVNGTALSYARVKGVVPANTPLLVCSTTTGDKEAVLGKLADAVTPENNSLLASDGTITGDESSIYVLDNIDGALGWYLKTSGVTVTEGKCYLQVNAGVKFIGIDGAVTGISEVSTTPAAPSAARYSLAGQRVNAGYKGIVIENGKKYLIK